MHPQQVEIPMSVISPEPNTSSRSSERDSSALVDMAAVMRRQQWQDFLFHKLTFGFALFVLMVLVGIIISLIIKTNSANPKVNL